MAQEVISVLTADQVAEAMRYAGLPVRKSWWSGKFYTELPEPATWVNWWGILPPVPIPLVAGLTLKGQELSNGEIRWEGLSQPQTVEERKFLFRLIELAGDSRQPIR
jgi:hypothetical protein